MNFSTTNTLATLATPFKGHGCTHHTASIVPFETYVSKEGDCLVAEPAVYCPKQNKVFFVAGSKSHGDVSHVYDFGANSNQESLNDHIFGFLTTGGFFFNRLQMHILLKKHHDSIIAMNCRNLRDDPYFNSQMINWQEARFKARMLAIAKERGYGK